MQDSVRSAPEQGEYLSVLQPTLAYNVSKQPENKQFSSGITYSGYNDNGNLYAYNGKTASKTEQRGLRTIEDEKFKEKNPIAYNALTDLSKTWEYLELLENQEVDSRIDLKQMKSEVAELATVIRTIGNSKYVFEPLGVSDRLNSVEKVLYASNNERGQDLIWAGLASRKATQHIFGNGYAVDENSDAFRHSYWNAASTALVGPEFAKNWANAHEYGYYGNFTKEAISGTYMDLFNNRVGRYQGDLLGLGAYDEDIKKAILDRVDSGGLLRLKDGKLVSTDKTGRM